MPRGAAPLPTQQQHDGLSQRRRVPPAAGDVLHHHRQQLHVRRRANPGVVFLADPEAVEYMPKNPKSRALFVCEAFLRGEPCTRPPAVCPDVHIDLAFTRKLRPQFRTMGDHSANAEAQRLGPRGLRVVLRCPLQRCRHVHQPPSSAEGNAAAVAAHAQPPSSPVSEWPMSTGYCSVDAADCLMTRAAEAIAAAAGEAEGPSPLALCPHFSRKKVCDFGADCRHVHALADPQPHQLLPPTCATPASTAHVTQGRSGSDTVGTTSSDSIVSRGYPRYRHFPYSGERGGWRCRGESDEEEE